MKKYTITIELPEEYIKRAKEEQKVDFPEPEDIHIVARKRSEVETLLNEGKITPQILESETMIISGVANYLCEKNGKHLHSDEAIKNKIDNEISKALKGIFGDKVNVKNLHNSKVIQESLNMKKDNRKKEVGDKVKVFDWSYAIEKNSLKDVRDVCNKENCIGKEAIVIESGLNIKSKENKYIEEDIKVPACILDTLIKFPTGEEIYVCSDFIERTDKSLV